MSNNWLMLSSYVNTYCVHCCWCWRRHIVLIVELENVKQNFCILRLQCSVNSLLLLVLAYLRKLRSYVGFVLALSAYLLFFFWILLTAIGGRPKPELCFLPRRLRWTLLPKKLYGNSLNGCGSNTQRSRHLTTALLPLFCRPCIPVGPAFTVSEFDGVGGLGFAFDVFCVTLLFLASQSLLVLNC